MASYEQQAEVLSRLSAFSHRNKTNFNKRDAVLHEIQRHRENKAASIRFRKNVLESQKRTNYQNERLRGIMTSGLVHDAPSKNTSTNEWGNLRNLQVNQCTVKGMRCSVLRKRNRNHEQKGYMKRIKDLLDIKEETGVITLW